MKMARVRLIEPVDLNQHPEVSAREGIGLWKPDLNHDVADVTRSGHRHLQRAYERSGGWCSSVSPSLRLLVCAESQDGRRIGLMVPPSSPRGAGSPALLKAERGDYLRAAPTVRPRSTPPFRQWAEEEHR